jgi:hypothetical protein
VRFPAFDDWLTVTMQASDRDACQRPPRPAGRGEDEAQCDINLRRSPRLEHYPPDYTRVVASGETLKEVHAKVPEGDRETVVFHKVLPFDALYIPSML